jgi:hypothetical protein
MLNVWVFAWFTTGINMIAIVIFKKILLISRKVLILQGFHLVYRGEILIFMHKKRALIGSIKGFCRSQ